ncbi:hypothetical protein VCHC41A1_2476 [Vibrio cholerae HC-41A1]|nr:hypothetical protein VCHC47A1_2598 [Vibrio cholerae HC-47A1]EKG49028.1 hypothetical protein VCHC41A1_2476 [Vibrio cholerae HC-41A1]EKG59882.1 hypothetical protein VCHC55A1_2552 [Vibrio cholerae HC-55A1]KKP18549.1 hypothetical protein VS85_00900 [Vibrio cholerae]
MYVSCSLPGLCLVVGYGFFQDGSAMFNLNSGFSYFTMHRQGCSW